MFFKRRGKITHRYSHSNMRMRISEYYRFLTLLTLYLYIFFLMLNYQYSRKLTYLIIFFSLFTATPVVYGSSRLGIKSKLQLLAYATATARADPCHICNLGSLWQLWILNPLKRPGMEHTSSWTLYWVLNLLSHNGNSLIIFFSL